MNESLLYPYLMLSSGSCVTLGVVPNKSRVKESQSVRALSS